MKSYKVFPFAAVCGQERVKKALLLNVINSNIGGVLISGEKGTAKSTLVRGLAGIAGDRSVVDLPLNTTEDRLVGSIDIEKAVKYGKRELEEGLLKEAHGQFLYVDEVNLLNRHIVNILLEVAASGVNVVEREGISCSHPSRFVLVGSMNPEEGLLCPQLTDRFGLYVEAKGEKDIDTRAEIIKRRLDYERSPAGFCRKWQQSSDREAEKISRARELLKEVEVSEGDCRLAAALSAEGRCAGHRAEIILVEAAKAIAALEGRTYITGEDMKEAAAYVLPHRMREPSGLEEINENPRESGKEEQENVEGRQPEEEEKVEEPGEGIKGEGSLESSEAQDCIEAIEQWSGELSIKMEADRKAAAKGTGKRSKVRTGGRQGRYVRYKLPGGKVRDIALAPTLRIAAWSGRDRKDGEPAILIRQEDIREKVRERQTGATILFAVDASGSMGAKKRMGAVKGAVLSLLNDAYQKRDSIGIIAFRNDHAEILLNITRSVDLAEKRLAGLPTGGRTPLAAGLYKAYELLKADKAKNPGSLQYLVLVSDGKANVPLVGGNAFEDALTLGEKIRNEGIRSMVLDTENSYIQFGLAKELSKKMDSRYVKMQDISKPRLEEEVRSLVKNI